MIFKALYAVFLLIIAAILIFSGSSGRRHLVLAVACGGVITFILRFVYPGLESGNLLAVQLLFFPILVMVTWVLLFTISRIRRR